ncbi:Rieske (2Fe-2S) protein [Sphingomonas populi]|uniref:Rieske (2Fe-2S) protein n=1 Tax=Sphingomonas populi TaxID=2484750 RepID=A0A4Q6XTC5_9SPHN|nr:Rieske (2Fe-2S) protein [Sphingomonas populi]RZF63211.1 Rieske (2Fe-2S) protein [Sphingomonas populi]
MTDSDPIWQPLCPAADFPEAGKLAAQLGGWSVLVVHSDDGFHAVNDRCTHQAAMLSPGKVRRGAIMCPLHGARFEAGSGRCIGGTYPDLRRFDIRITDGIIEVAVPASPPGPNERPAPPS